MGFIHVHEKLSGFKKIVEINDSTAPNGYGTVAKEYTALAFHEPTEEPPDEILLVWIWGERVFCFIIRKTSKIDGVWQVIWRPPTEAGDGGVDAGILQKTLITQFRSGWFV